MIDPSQQVIIDYQNWLASLTKPKTINTSDNEPKAKSKAFWEEEEF